MHIFNQRDVDGILAMIATLGRLVGASARAETLVVGLEQQIVSARRDGEARRDRLGRTPRVPLRGVGRADDLGNPLVSELIGIAGGEDIFAELALKQGAAERIIADPRRS